MQPWSQKSARLSLRYAKVFGCQDIVTNPHTGGSGAALTTRTFLLVMLEARHVPGTGGDTELLIPLAVAPPATVAIAVTVLWLGRALEPGCGFGLRQGQSASNVWATTSPRS
jgi:hypothetical protein